MSDCIDRVRGAPTLDRPSATVPTGRRGENLRPRDIRAMRMMRRDGFKIAVIAVIFGVADSTVSRALRRDR